MPKPRVSVLLPVFDAAEFLPACLNSLNRQTLKDFELVAVDDGSEDDSLAILKKWARNDDRIQILTGSHQGLVSSLNRGLAMCSGRFVARMDADDIAHPRRLELQVQAFESTPGLSVVSCLVRHFPVSRVARGFKLYDEWLNALVDHETMALERFVESPVAHPSVMVRNEAIGKVGGYRDLGWPEDYDLWLRLFEDGSAFAKVPKVLLFWRESAGRLSRTDKRYSSDAFLKCKAHFFARGPASGGKAVVVWGAGPNGKRLCRYLNEAGVDIKGLIDIDPAKIGRLIRGAEVFPPERLPAILDDRTVVVAAVASRGARHLIRQSLSNIGLHEGRQFWCLL